VIREISYEKYTDTEDGQKIFQGKEKKLGEHKTARVMIKEITSKKEFATLFH
jgi:hypothetical protein